LVLSGFRSLKNNEPVAGKEVVAVTMTERHLNIESDEASGSQVAVAPRVKEFGKDVPENAVIRMSLKERLNFRFKMLFLVWLNSTGMLCFALFFAYFPPVRYCCM
jgi:hypothetical protein